MAHLMNDFHVGVPSMPLTGSSKDPRKWPTFWVGMDASPRVFGDGSPGTKAEFYQHMMGVKVRMVDRTVEERHNPDGSTRLALADRGGDVGHDNRATTSPAPTAPM